MISQQLFLLPMLPNESSGKCWPQWPQLSINQQHPLEQIPSLDKEQLYKSMQQCSVSKKIKSEEDLSLQLNEMDQQYRRNSMEIQPIESKPTETIGDLIKNIQSQNRKQDIIKRKKNKTTSTSSKSSVSSFDYDSKQVKNQQSKCWDNEQQSLFKELLAKYGTDFNIIKQFFPKKSKNQIKNKYKQMFNKKNPTKQKTKVSKMSFEKLKLQGKKTTPGIAQKVQEDKSVKQVVLQDQSDNQNLK